MIQMFMRKNFMVQYHSRNIFNINYFLTTVTTLHICNIYEGTGVCVCVCVCVCLCVCVCVYRPSGEQAAQGHMTIELQKSLLEQMNSRLRETEEHIRQEIANKVSIRVSHIFNSNMIPLVI